ncbi:50S ribosomal protein L18 [Algoriphagus sp. NF]|jgi:large subunit ribosomal protein L18|uniref:Large ribosomal subunit protein uL18 n=3 Tax=Algoriphagus TaxID=246875 RepID=A0ABS7N7I1_9BACT|nr:MULTISPECIES: 50S ribosomal protein L18 [Algoriphagus]KPQ16844.1 MAG: LSU ribosomal protein L18 RplR [Algoriphagus marincola HL-49]MCR9081974.1 50S ribosomal protein L18 [Cyclobacteriaceae bacterium]MBY5952284.1 50S ribosomal protein L18 [Algoriphagus marincola]MDE0559873.1 50S ribosomal protein L18 [Algoriphagus sp. NF]TDK44715.1 50S ribosomal protein L18 [Algoriphagus aquimaris]
MAFNKNSRRLRIKQGIRRKISGTDSRPRLSVFKSNTGIYAQLVDDLKGHTLAHASSKELGVERNINVEISKEVGKKLAEKATANGVSSVVFDRNGYLFHGNIKALADGAREGGLKF